MCDVNNAFKRLAFVTYPESPQPVTGAEEEHCADCHERGRHH